MNTKTILTLASTLALIACAGKDGDSGSTQTGTHSATGTHTSTGSGTTGTSTTGGTTTGGTTTGGTGGTTPTLSFTITHSGALVKTAFPFTTVKLRSL